MDLVHLLNNLNLPTDPLNHHIFLRLSRQIHTTWDTTLSTIRLNTPRRSTPHPPQDPRLRPRPRPQTRTIPISTQLCRFEHVILISTTKNIFSWLSSIFVLISEFLLFLGLIKTFWSLQQIFCFRFKPRRKKMEAHQKKA